MLVHFASSYFFKKFGFVFSWIGNEEEERSSWSLVGDEIQYFIKFLIAGHLIIIYRCVSVGYIYHVAYQNIIRLLENAELINWFYHM